MSDSLIPFIVGLILLPVAAEYLVRGSVALADRAGVAPLVVGLTVVAFGTSVPELVVCIGAALEGAPGIAFGNVIGSNIANILLILGTGALLKPVTCDARDFLRDSLAMLAATALFIAFVLRGSIGFWQGAIMLGVLAVYVLSSYWREKREAGGQRKEGEERDSFKKANLWIIALSVTGGLLGVIVGADLLVSGAVEIARGFGVPEEVIGLTMVAIGTSLPELATSIMAALRGHGDVGLGNVLGSNIFNLLAIIGATAMVSPMVVPDQVMRFDVWVMGGVSLILIAIMLSRARLSKAHLSKAHLGRGEAMVFLAGYIAYIGIQFVGVETLL